MTDVKLEDAERLAIELRVVSRMLSRDLKDAAAFSCDKAAALLRKIPELQKEIHYLKMPFSAIEKEFTSEGLDTNIAMNALCKRAESHRKHIARLEQQLAERSAELEAERTRAHSPEWQPMDLIKKETWVVLAIHRENGHHTRWVSFVDDIGWADDVACYHKRLEDIHATHWMPLPEPRK